MKDTVQIGFNRTGVQMSPRFSARMTEGSQRYSPEKMPNDEIQNLRAKFISQSNPIGTVPLPGNMKGALSEAWQKLEGKRPELLLDKMGERLAFERTGARLYEALILKCDESSIENLPLVRLREIHAQEIAHFHLLNETIESIGADPTAQTPCADVAAVASMGLVQAAFDPRVNVAQTLNVILTAELTDGAGWETLVELADEAGLGDRVDQFQTALLHEEEHITTIRALIDQVL
jgi:hypothetical protein